MASPTKVSKDPLKIQRNTSGPRAEWLCVHEGVSNTAYCKTDHAGRTPGEGEGVGEGGFCNHTDTTGSHVGGNHDGALAHLELVEHPVALVLLLVAVNRKCGPAILAKETGDVVGDTLGASENQNLAGLVLHDLLNVLEHLVALLELGDDLDLLGDAVVGGKLHGTNSDLDPVGLVVGRELTDLLGPSGGPHASLTVGANLADDLADLGLETHVQHAVGLVENQVGDTAKVGLAHLEHVDQTTGSGNADLDTSGEVADLLALRHTTVDAGVPNARRLAKLADLLLNLDSELTGGSEDEDDRAVAGREERLRVDVNNSGKTVAKSLAGTGLGNTDNIATRESHGPALRLNGSGLSEALGLDLVHDVSREASLVEGLNRPGNVVTGEGHVVVGAELVDIRLRACSDGRVLLVERLLELGHGTEVPVLLLQTSAELTHPVTTAAATTTAVASTTTSVAAIATAIAVAAVISAKSLLAYAFKEGARKMDKNGAASAHRPLGIPIGIIVLRAKTAVPICIVPAAVSSTTAAATAVAAAISAASVSAAVRHLIENCGCEGK